MMAMLQSLFAQQSAESAKQNAELAKQNAEFATKLDAKLDQQSAEAAKQNDQLAKKLDQQSSQLAELRAEQAAKFEKMEGEMQEFDGRVKELESKLKEMENRLESRSSNSEGSPQQNSTNIARETVFASPQQNNTTIARETVFASSRGVLKPPTFDGETPFENFKVQFQAAVRHNGWSTEEQLNALIVALRDKAADVLQTISATEMSSERILRELELRYGQSHTQELCKIQLHNRRQQRGESLQDLEREVTKLARQAYSKVPLDVLNGLTVDAFIHAVRDDHLKLHLRTNARGKTMNEVLASALEYEAARASLSTDPIKLRKLDAEDIAQIEALIDKRLKRPTSLSTDFIKLRKFDAEDIARIEALIDKRIKRPTPSCQSSTRRRSRSRSLCFKCQQPGHFQRDCKVAAGKPTVTQPDNRERILQSKAQREDGTSRCPSTDHHKHIVKRKEKDCSTIVVRQIKVQREDEVTHKRGISLNNVDGKSRRPCVIRCKHRVKREEKNGSATVARIRVNGEDKWTVDQLSQDQERDTSIAPVIRWVADGKRPSWQEIASETATVKSYWAQWQSLRLNDKLLVRTWESADGKTNKQQVVLPANRIPEVLQEIHNGKSGAHLGINKTLDKIRDRFYWVNCRKDVEDWCRTCNVCAASKGPQTRTRGKMQQYNVGAPFERIAMDVAGPFPVTKDGNRYILVCIDYFSKWVEAYPIVNQEARTIADTFVNNWVCRFGVPLELHSDQGRNFESSVFQELCQILGIKKTRTTPLHPQSDGMVERFNRTLEEHLRKEVNANQDNWDQCIPLFMMGYRSAVHDTTGNSPSMVVFGRELRLPCDIRFGCPEIEPVAKQDYVADLRRKMVQVHDAVKNRIGNASDRMKTRYDLRANSGGFQEGDLVWLYNPRRKKGRSPKLQQSWEGPYTVIKRMNDVVYRIQLSPRSKMKVVHIDRLTRYNGRSTDEFVRDEQN